MRQEKRQVSAVTSAATNTANGIRAIARGGAPGEREPNPTVELRNLQLPDQLVQFLKELVKSVGGVIEPLPLPDPYDEPVERTCTVLRTAKQEQRILLHMSKRILDNWNGNNSNAVSAQSYVLGKSISTIYMFSEGLDMPHRNYRNMWQKWRSDGYPKVEWIPWRDVTDLFEGGDSAFQRKVLSSMLDLDYASLGGLVGNGPGLPARPAERRGVFICYSHADVQWLDKVLIALRSLPGSDTMRIWSDKAIESGDQWHESIMENLANSTAAILLISPDFLASNYIKTKELPGILARYKDLGMRVLPLIVRPSTFAQHEELARFQTVNQPDNPLSKVDPAEVDSALTKLANDVYTLFAAN